MVLLTSTVDTKRVVRNVVMFAGLASAMLLVVAPIFKSGFVRSCMASLSAALAFRQAHWEDSLYSRDTGLATTLFGMGLGRFPQATCCRSTLDPKAGAHRLVQEAGNTFLRLDAGDSIGVEQIVSLEAGQTYLLKLDFRPSFCKPCPELP